jgi:S-formylglutathione hydrolase FrmB
MERRRRARGRWACGLLVASTIWLLALSPRVASAQAAGALRGALRVDTLWSQSLGTTKRLFVYLPPSYARDTAARYPVLVYLHGVGGNEENWVRLARLDRVMDSLIARGQPEAIVVMPDGDDSWYTTWHTLPDAASCQADTTREEAAATYCVPWPHYDDYIARDLVQHVDASYRTRAEARSRGIAGLSMGGYGAMSLALRYPDVFAAAASHSGVLAPAWLGPRPFAEPAVWARTPDELREAAGTTRYERWFAPRFGRDTVGWYAREPARLAERLVRAGTPVPALFFDCGVGDVYLDQNRAFAATLRELGLSYRYAELPGAHTWDYWRAQLPQSLTWLLLQVTRATPDGPGGGASGRGA